MPGENLPLVGGIFDYKRHHTTASYVHLADAQLVEAAERRGDHIAAAITQANTTTL